MATYLPNVSDFLMPVQVFNPNWQFFEASLMQMNAKQQAAIDNLENAFYVASEAELIHEENKKLREEWQKTYKNTVQNLSKLDLTKAENINYAKSLFDTILDNNSFLDDYAKTKYWRSELAKADQNRADYNATSKEAIEMQMMEYSISDFNTRKNIQPFKYIPYIDENKTALDVLQKINPEIKYVRKSEDGRYIITYTNGREATEPISNLSFLIMKGDPRIKERYKQEAYIKRMDYFMRYGAEEGYRMFVEDLNKDIIEYQRAINSLENNMSSLAKERDREQEVLSNNISQLELLKEMNMLGEKNIADLSGQYTRLKVLNANLEKAQELYSESRDIMTIYEKKKLLLSDAYDDFYANRRILEKANVFGKVYAGVTAKTEIKADEFALEHLKGAYKLKAANIAASAKGKDEEMKISNFYINIPNVNKIPTVASAKNNSLINGLQSTTDSTIKYIGDKVLEKVPSEKGQVTLSVIKKGDKLLLIGAQKGEKTTYQMVNTGTVGSVNYHGMVIEPDNRFFYKEYDDLNALKNDTTLTEAQKKLISTITDENQIPTYQ